jgi:hypothetical protein
MVIAFWWCNSSSLFSFLVSIILLWLILKLVTIYSERNICLSNQRTLGYIWPFGTSLVPVNGSIAREHTLLAEIYLITLKYY